MGWAGHNSPILQPLQHPSASPGTAREELGAIPKLCSGKCPKKWAQPCCSPEKGVVPAIPSTPQLQGHPHTAHVAPPCPNTSLCIPRSTQHHTGPHPSLHLSFLLQPKREICLCQQGGQELRRDKSASAGVTVGQRDKKIHVGKASGCREN